MCLGWWLSHIVKPKVSCFQIGEFPTACYLARYLLKVNIQCSGLGPGVFLLPPLFGSKDQTKLTVPLKAPAHFGRDQVDWLLPEFLNLGTNHTLGGIILCGGGCLLDNAFHLYVLDVCGIPSIRWDNKTHLHIEPNLLRHWRRQNHLQL